tara:strand:+ start:558 stop:965 length:408 start_codon:yes stop_codon:yes gene_type:complete
LVRERFGFEKRKDKERDKESKKQERREWLLWDTHVFCLCFLFFFLCTFYLFYLFTFSPFPLSRSGSDLQIEFLVQHGCVAVLCELLSHPNMLVMAMEGLEKLLQVGDERACRLANCKTITDPNCGPNLHASKSKF